MSIISLGCEAPQPTFDVARRANEEVLQLDFAEAPVTAAAHAMPTRQFTDGNQSVLTWPASAGRTQELLTELLAAGIPIVEDGFERTCHAIILGKDFAVVGNYLVFLTVVCVRAESCGIHAPG